MTTISSITSRPPRVPDWIDAWVGETTHTQNLTDPADPRLTGSASWGERFGHVQVVVHGAADVSNLELQHTTAEAYELIHHALADSETPHAIRLWNFIPGIVNDADIEAHLDRYMVFNAGRYAAYLEWYETPDRFDQCIATATGVGHVGTDLIVHCLADRTPGTPIENPRQCAAYHYSHRYGPMPPCFARATRIVSPNDPSQIGLLIGGTSSVVGEESVHIGDVHAQAEETFTNIEALIREAGGDGLQDLDNLRVYHVESGDGPALEKQVLKRLPHLRGRVELVRAALCRRDLAVEIEGLAHVR